MPLSSPPERELVHTRTIDIKAYQRQDGLMDIEGHLVDVKPFAHSLTDTHREANEPVHDMWLRFTIDNAQKIVDAEAVLDRGAHTICHFVEPNFKDLAGLTIGPGLNKRIHERVGHGKGCTHLVAMAAQIASAALQAVWTSRSRSRDPDAKSDWDLESSGQLDSCYAYRPDSEFVRDYFPSSYRPRT